jgi:hypothetical protein
MIDIASRVISYHECLTNVAGDEPSELVRTANQLRTNPNVAPLALNMSRAVQFWRHWSQEDTLPRLAGLSR